MEIQFEYTGSLREAAHKYGSLEELFDFEKLGPQHYLIIVTIPRSDYEYFTELLENDKDVSNIYIEKSIYKEQVELTDDQYVSLLSQLTFEEVLNALYAGDCVAFFKDNFYLAEEFFNKEVAERSYYDKIIEYIINNRPELLA